MKKFSYILLIVAVLPLLLGGCCRHDWQAAGCTTPESCSICGETRGEAPGHDWQAAGCTAPESCSRCGITQGEALGHSWQEASCTLPRSCSVCGETDGEAPGHLFVGANFQQGGRCQYCGEPGEALPAAFDALGLEAALRPGESVSYPVPCADDAGRLTNGKLTIVEYDVSPEEPEAAEGYEWRRVSFTLSFEDENAAQYGCSWTICLEDWYDPAARDASLQTLSGGAERFTLNWYGKDYTDCYSIVETESSRTETGILLQGVCALCVPAGYDGMVLGFRDPAVSRSEAQCITELDNSSTLFFRLA